MRRNSILIALLVAGMTVAATPAVASSGESADGEVLIDLTVAEPGDVVLEGELEEGVCTFPDHSTTMEVDSDNPYLLVTYGATSDCNLEVKDVCTSELTCGANAASIRAPTIRTDTAQTIETSDVIALEYCAAWKKVRAAHRTVDSTVLGDYTLTEVVETFKFEYGCEDNEANWLYADSSSDCYTWDADWTIKNCYQDQPTARTGCAANGVTGDFERTDGSGDHWLHTEVEGCDDGSYSCSHDESSWTPGDYLESECKVTDQGQN